MKKLVFTLIIGFISLIITGQTTIINIGDSVIVTGDNIKEITVVKIEFEDGVVIIEPLDSIVTDTTPQPIDTTVVELIDTTIVDTTEIIVPVDTVIADTTEIIEYPSDVYGQNAKGSIPELLSDKMLVGVKENQGYTWMKESGVNWNSRYMYLSEGWINNWGWSTDSGAHAYNYMVNSKAINCIPVLEFYPLTYIEGEGDIDLYSKLSDDYVMNAYFTQFKKLIERAVQFDDPVIILIEADALPFLQIQCGSNPQEYASISDCGLTELSDLPNTIAGWGLAFLEIKQKLGADKVILGMHVSHWATGEDLMYQSYTKELESSVDEVYNFLSTLGVNENQTGIEYDFLVMDPLDRDSDFYTVQYSQDRWLDASEDASIYSKSFNRYAEWLRLWNEKSEKRIMLWQIPLGNQWHLNENNANVGLTYYPNQGYKDNKVEYFMNFDNMAKLADCGVIGFLFGAGATYQSTYHNDFNEDGELYMKTKAEYFYNNGGMTLKR